MKHSIHPDCRSVVFRDANTGAAFLTRSTDSHPLWTGTQRHTDSAGQIEKFHRRYGRRAGSR